MAAGPEGKGMVGAQPIPGGLPASEKGADRADQLTVVSRSPDAAKAPADQGPVVRRQAPHEGAIRADAEPTLVVARPTPLVFEPEPSGRAEPDKFEIFSPVTDVEKNVAEVGRRLQEGKFEGVEAVWNELDEATKAHTERVALLARAAAQTLGLDADKAEVAGLYHDIGKVYKDLLPKFGSATVFTKEVRKTMSLSHSLYGEETVGFFQDPASEDVQHLEIAKKAARFHHAIDSEEFSELPPQDQAIITIVAMADQLDAMMLDPARKYRDKRAEKGVFTIDDVQKEWANKIGRHLTAELVEAFVNEVVPAYTNAESENAEAETVAATTWAEDSLYPLYTAPHARPFMYFEPVTSDERDRFGNQIVTSEDKAYHDRQGNETRASMLVSREGENFIKANPDIIQDIDRGIQIITDALQSGTDWESIDEVTLSEGRRLSVHPAGKNGHESLIFVLVVGKEKYIIEKHQQRNLVENGITQPYINKMLQVQAIATDKATELKEAGVAMPTYLFATGQMACIKYTEGDYPIESRDLIEKMRKLKGAIVDYIDTEESSLWNHVWPDTTTNENFIQRTVDNLLEWIDPVYYNPMM